MSFTDLSLDAALLRGIADLGFTEATPIQRAALPPALAGRDVLAAAMTGSGKTAAFVLPILQRLVTNPGGGTRALVLTPTRELAAQVHEHLVKLGRYVRVSSATVFGGVGAVPQIRALRSGANVVVATPGRLLDLMGQGAARFDRLEVLVLDEADRMLDMGFLPDVRRILAALPRRRQTLLFSATLPAPIVTLSREVLSDPERIDVERKAAPAVGITHAVFAVTQQRKSALLVELLHRDAVPTALVFTRTKHRANRVAQFLDRAGIACERIHGNRTQAQREKALAAFKGGRLQVLVATDIAARGIDVRELSHVINYDVPVQAEDYIHRVGRTARAAATGTAITFAAPEEEPTLGSIERAVGARFPRRAFAGFDASAWVDERAPAPAPVERGPVTAATVAPGRRFSGPRPVGRPPGGPRRRHDGRRRTSSPAAGPASR